MMRGAGEVMCGYRVCRRANVAALIIYVCQVGSLPAAPLGIPRRDHLSDLDDRALPDLAQRVVRRLAHRCAIQAA
jgi:hypothetical protein